MADLLEEIESKAESTSDPTPAPNPSPTRTSNPTPVPNNPTPTSNASPNPSPNPNPNPSKAGSTSDVAGVASDIADLDVADLEDVCEVLDSLHFSEQEIWGDVGEM